MIETMNTNQLENRINEFLGRKSRQFPELHLREKDHENFPLSEPRRTAVWFKEVHKTKTI